MGAGSATFRRRFHSDKEFVPFDVITCGGWSAAGEGLVLQFEIEDPIGFHEDPVGKKAAAGAGDLIAEQLD